MTRPFRINEQVYYVDTGPDDIGIITDVRVNAKGFIEYEVVFPDTDRAWFRHNQLAQ